MVEGKIKEEREKWSEEELLKAIKKELANKKSAKEISSELAKRSGWPKREVYKRVF